MSARRVELGEEEHEGHALLVLGHGPRPVHGPREHGRDGEVIHELRPLRGLRGHDTLREEAYLVTRDGDLQWHRHPAVAIPLLPRHAGLVLPRLVRGRSFSFIQKPIRRDESSK